MKVQKCWKCDTCFVGSFWFICMVAKIAIALSLPIHFGKYHEKPFHSTDAKCEYLTFKRVWIPKKKMYTHSKYHLIHVWHFRKSAPVNLPEGFWGGRVKCHSCRSFCSCEIPGTNENNGKSCKRELFSILARHQGFCSNIFRMRSTYNAVFCVM